MRVGVFLDYRFRRAGGQITTERAFALFVFALARRMGGLTLIGRADPATQPYPYAAPPEVEFAPLPHYESLANPARAARALVRGAARMWRILDELDAVWVLGPNPLALVLAPLGILRGRTVVLGVRQNTQAYVASRHPGRRGLVLAGWLMDRAFRLLARHCPTVAVGEEIARQYRRSPAVHQLVVSLVHACDVRAPDPSAEARFEGRVVAVGRLDTEKNPLLLAEVLALLVAAEPDRGWRLDVYGDGPMAGQLEARFRDLGLEDRVVMHGYVSAADGLASAYRDAEAFLHVSWTEGVPQVLVEAFAARVAVVATDVGGVAGLVQDGALLMPAGDAEAAARALRRVADDPALRSGLLDAGTAVALDRTLEAEVERLAAFLQGAAGPTTPIAAGSPA